MQAPLECRGRFVHGLLDRLGALGALLAVALSPGFASSQDAGGDEELLGKARAIHDRVLALDTHIDIDTDNFTAERNYSMELPTQATLAKMEAGGLDVGWFVVYTRQGPLDADGYAAAYANAIDKFEAIHRLAADFAPERIEVALTADEARRIAAEGRLVAMIGVENAYPLGEEIGRIEEFHGMGARYMSLSHNGHNQLSDSHTGEKDGDWMHGGLSEMGRRAIAEMNRLGIIVDISHPSRESIMQTLELSRAPVIASHSSVRALADVSRNLDDETLHAVAANGGVVHAVPVRSFVDRTKAEEEVDVADFVDHIDYMVELIGIEHVGISSDFDGGGGVNGWDDASETFNVTLELVRRGYTEEEIAMLWSENLLRVLDEVQAVAAQIQEEDRLAAHHTQ